MILINWVIKVLEELLEPSASRNRLHIGIVFPAIKLGCWTVCMSSDTSFYLLQSIFRKLFKFILTMIIGSSHWCRRAPKWQVAYYAFNPAACVYFKDSFLLPTLHFCRNDSIFVSGEDFKIRVLLDATKVFGYHSKGCRAAFRCTI